MGAETPVKGGSALPPRLDHILISGWTTNALDRVGEELHHLASTATVKLVSPATSIYSYAHVQSGRVCARLRMPCGHVWL